MFTLPSTLQGTLIISVKFHPDRSSHSRETVRTKCVEEEYLEMQLQAIGDVAPVVTMATDAMLVMTPTHCGHCFYEVLSQNVKLYPRNMK
jgi:predicted Zn-ribbon and HTH transcriptional regulator